ncbi:hypothetical protein TEA_012519 [Camellia sinensis var. sinensis]|uniref:Choline transporter-like protein n=1 Tax=Camellia sinensis var. sinensis TaxID=542762 RepID=A0A4S4E3J6_CAMSN|nr:hypothetical protein TEA_012519 [Camellia sinensis var. sinensis]
MSDSQSPSSYSSNSGSPSAPQQNVGQSCRSASGGVDSLSPGLALEGSRHWRDIFWRKDMLYIGTEDYWPLYAVAGGIGTVLGWIWLLLLGSRANQMMKFAVHILTTYLAVISVLCFWGDQFFCGVAFAIGAAFQFLYVISVIDRLLRPSKGGVPMGEEEERIRWTSSKSGGFEYVEMFTCFGASAHFYFCSPTESRTTSVRLPFTMLVLQGAVKMVWNLPEVMRVSCAFMVVMLLWLALWSFGAAGVMASNMSDQPCWWFLVVFSVSLFWTGAVLCNTVHVIVSGMVFLVLIHGGREAASMPSKPLMKSLRYAVTTSFGSICYGSLFTASIRTLRWEIRGFRSKIGNNECLLCCVDFLFHLVETLVRFFNKYAYVQIAAYGKSFNHSARDAWELFQSTGVEALVAYDCSGAVLLMGTLLGGLITGTGAGVWTMKKYPDRVIMVGSTAMLMGMILVGLAMVVVESAVTSIYICYAEDPLLIHRWDAEFFNQMSETLHQRLQHRSARAREVLTHSRLDGHRQETLTI